LVDIILFSINAIVHFFRKTWRR